MLKRALFAGAALVIGAMYMQGAVTPASAGPNVKPNVRVAQQKPRIRIIKPKIRLKVDPKRLTRDKRENLPGENLPGTRAGKSRDSDPSHKSGNLAHVIVLRADSVVLHHLCEISHSWC